MTAVWALLAIVLALVAQSGLTLLVPRYAALFDPLLLIAVYVSLKRGETWGMLVGGATGWAQEIVFGGEILGFQGLARVVLGFLVGQAGRRFLLSAAPAQFIVVLLAVLLDNWLAARLAALFEVPYPDIPWMVLLARMALNAAAGALAFRLAEHIEARATRDTLG